MPPRPERRRVTRVETGIGAVLRGRDGGETVVRLADLSVVGLRGRTTGPLKRGATCEIELTAQGTVIEARGTIVRARGREVAVRFDELPFESYEALRAFLLVHAEDPAVIADELTDRLGHLGENAA